MSGQEKESLACCHMVRPGGSGQDYRSNRRNGEKEKGRRKRKEREIRKRKGIYERNKKERAGKGTRGLIIRIWTKGNSEEGGQEK